MDRWIDGYGCRYRQPFKVVYSSHWWTIAATRAVQKALQESAVLWRHPWRRPPGKNWMTISRMESPSIAIWLKVRCEKKRVYGNGSPNKRFDGRRETITESGKFQTPAEFCFKQGRCSERCLHGLVEVRELSETVCDLEVSCNSIQKSRACWYVPLQCVAQNAGVWPRKMKHAYA